MHTQLPKAITSSAEVIGCFANVIVLDLDRDKTG